MQRLLSFFVRSLELTPETGHLVLKQVHFFNYFALFLIWLGNFAIHHPRCLLDLFLKFANLICKVRKFFSENLLIGVVMNGHFCFEGIQGFKGSLFRKLDVFADITFLLNLGFKHVLKVLNFFGQCFPITSVLRNIFSSDKSFHLINHFIDF